MRSTPNNHFTRAAAMNTPSSTGAHTQREQEQEQEKEKEREQEVLQLLGLLQEERQQSGQLRAFTEELQVSLTLKH